MSNSKASAPPVALTGKMVDKMLGTIRIPPRPSLLSDVQRELSCEEPSPNKLASIIGQDVAMAGALLKLANSPFVGFRLKANSVSQAIMRLGMEQSSLLLTGILAKDAVKIEGVSLTPFWDSSTKRALAMSHLAKQMTLSRADIAHTFGLFSNIGIPLMMSKFINYGAVVESDTTLSVTQLEDDHFQTNHAALGSLMARTWGLPEDIVDAILLHHYYQVFNETHVKSVVRNLVALGLLVDYCVTYQYSASSRAEWDLGGQLALDYLGMTLADVDETSDQIHELFDDV